MAHSGRLSRQPLSNEHPAQTHGSSKRQTDQISPVTASLTSRYASKTASLTLHSSSRTSANPFSAPIFSHVFIWHRITETNVSWISTTSPKYLWVAIRIPKLAASQTSTSLIKNLIHFTNYSIVIQHSPLHRLLPKRYPMESSITFQRIVIQYNQRLESSIPINSRSQSKNSKSSSTWEFVTVEKVSGLPLSWSPQSPVPPLAHALKNHHAGDGESAATTAV